MIKYNNVPIIKTIALEGQKQTRLPHLWYWHVHTSFLHYLDIGVMNQTQPVLYSYTQYFDKIKRLKHSSTIESKLSKFQS